MTSQQLQELIRLYRPRNLPAVQHGNRKVLSFVILLHPPRWYPRLHVKATRIGRDHLLDIHMDWEQHGRSSAFHPFISQVILKIQTI